ncbi:DUF2730 family protein [Mesorhizobium sp. AR07]|uniref:DUF2730 family protein n=1 Tax=Mesorhizobium sp. AR07 TaxID=2865838 RepID=UPI00215EFF42|nr:DUF2730 family protein [Mesorhizobium sp. AR07]
MDLNLLMPWLGAAALILSLGNTVNGFFTSGAKQTAKDLTTTKNDLVGLISTLTKLVEDQDRRLQAVEIEMKHLPDAKSFMELRLSISDMAGKMGRLEESQLGVSRTVRRVENFLMKQGASEEE